MTAYSCHPSAKGQSTDIERVLVTRKRKWTAIDREGRVVRRIVGNRSAAHPPIVGKGEASLAQIDEYAARLDTVAPLELHSEVEVQLTRSASAAGSSVFVIFGAAYLIESTGDLTVIAASRLQRDRPRAA